MEEEYLICKACDYVFPAAKGYEECPACGVKKAAFAPYKYRISEKRRKILNLHIHPITVHFSEAFSVLNVFILFACIFITGWLYNDLMTVYKFNTVLLPFAVLASFATGLYDGKIRFKKVTTPLLKIKIWISALHTVLAIVMCVLVLLYPITGTIFWVSFVVSIFNLAATAVLGKLGGKLIESKMVGN